MCNPDVVIEVTYYNLPLQEPKLSAARRIVSEWTDYDEEMFRLGEQIARDRAEQKQGQDTPRDEL